MFIVLSTWQAIARVHSVHVINAEQCQMAADLWTKPTGLSHRPTYSQPVNCSHHRRLKSLLSLNTLFTIPRRVEG